MGDELGALGADVFALAEQRLQYIGQRQLVLAQNIANADTPDYRPRDLPRFEDLLRGGRVTQAVTDARHLVPHAEAAALVQAVPQERALNGNAVDVESELTKIAGNETNAALVGNLWKSYMGMYLNALGRNG